MSEEFVVTGEHGSYVRAEDLVRDEITGEHPGTQAMLKAVRSRGAGHGVGRVWCDDAGEWRAEVVEFTETDEPLQSLVFREDGSVEIGEP